MAMLKLLAVLLSSLALPLCLITVFLWMTN